MHKRFLMLVFGGICWRLLLPSESMSEVVYYAGYGETSPAERMRIRFPANLA